MAERFQLIPLSVEATQLSPANVDDVAIWCGGVQVVEVDPFDSAKKFVALNIPTLHGAERATEGDYIIKDRNGSFSVMGKVEFQTRYEQI